MSERKLATIQKIKTISPIKDADRIEVCTINGWQIVSQKGIHSVGDLVIYAEIDSFIPAEDIRFASFSERFTEWNGIRGMRVKTIKLKKCISQGIILPLKEFPEIKNAKEGDDVTDILKIVKWESAEEKSGNNGNSDAGGKFPSFLVKTDQERAQNILDVLETKLDHKFEATIKKDGSSMTVFCVKPNSDYYNSAKGLYKKEVKNTVWNRVKSLFKKKEQDKPVFGICSRNILLKQEGESNFHKAETYYNLFGTLNSLAGQGSFAIQGELVAPNIQGNFEKVSNVEFHVFSVFDINNQRYLTPVDRYNLLGNSVRHVSPVGTDTLRNLIGYIDGDSLIERLLAYAEGPSDNKAVKREGIVFKSCTEDFSFKTVANSYLLQKDK